MIDFIICAYVMAVFAVTADALNLLGDLMGIPREGTN